MEIVEARNLPSPFEGAGKYFNYSYSFGDLVEVKEKRHYGYEFSRWEGGGLYAFVVRETEKQVAVVLLQNIECKRKYSHADTYNKFSVRKA